MPLAGFEPTILASERPLGPGTMLDTSWKYRVANDRRKWIHFIITIYNLCINHKLNLPYIRKSDMAAHVV